MGEGINITEFGLAIGLIWSACVIVTILKGKIWSAAIGIISAMAVVIGWRIGSWHILNPFLWVPVIAAVRLGRPDSLWAYWFYSSRPKKYARAALKYDRAQEYLGL